MLLSAPTRRRLLFRTFRYQCHVPLPASARLLVCRRLSSRGQSRGPCPAWASSYRVCFAFFWLLRFWLNFLDNLDHLSNVAALPRVQSTLSGSSFLRREARAGLSPALLFY